MIDDPVLMKLKSPDEVAARIRDIKFGKKEASK